MDLHDEQNSLFIDGQIPFARWLLAELGSDGVRNNNRAFGSGEGQVIRESFVGDSIKRSRLSHSQFIDSDFSMAAVTGSQFSNVDFDNCRLHGVNFQNCDFSDSVFHARDWERKTVDFCHFGQSSFTNSTFDEVRFYGCSFHQTEFRRTRLMSAQIESSTLEGAEFIDCELSDMRLSQINLDFATFQNCQMDEVCFALYQVPYTFGGLDYLLSTHDNVWLSVSKDGAEHRIEPSAYRELLPELEAYYSDLGEFFPLANIMLVTERRDKAYEHIIAGVKKAIGEFDFRMVEYFAQLATRNNIFTMADKKQIYAEVEATAKKEITKTADMRRYLLHKPRIREILLDDIYGKQTLQMSFETSIPADDFESAAELGQMLNEVCEQYTGTESIHRVELRHSSNFQIGLMIVEELPVILPCLAAVMEIILSGMKIKEKRLSANNEKNYSAQLKELEAQVARLEQAQQEQGQKQEAHVTVERKDSRIEGELASETVEKMSFTLPESALKYVFAKDMTGVWSLLQKPESALE